MDCRCDTATELYGPEAEAYLAEHLQRAPDGTYSCPDTGKPGRSTRRPTRSSSG